MKCCSIEMKDLDRNFEIMSQRFCLLNDLNDSSLKTYVAFLPSEIQQELKCMAIWLPKMNFLR